MTRTIATAPSTLAAVALFWISASVPVLAQTDEPAPNPPSAKPAPASPAIMDTSPRHGTLGNCDTPTGPATQGISPSPPTGGSGPGYNLFRDRVGYGIRRY